MTLKLGTLIADIEVNTNDLDTAEQKVKKSTGNMEALFKKMGVAIAAVFAADKLVAAVKLTDQMRVLQGRIQRVTKTADGFNTAWQAINKSADEAGVSIADSAASFERFLMATSGLGATIDDVAKFNDLILKTGTISGASSTELSNALTQLGQGFQGGVIRAEEWNSIMEQAPEILRVVARNMDGVNGDLGELRKVMLAGELTADKFFNAFMDGSEDIQKEFEKIPKSLEQSMQTLNNQYTRMLTNLDNQYQVTARLAEALGMLAHQFDEVAQASERVAELEAINEGIKKNMQEQLVLIENGNELAKIGLATNQKNYDLNAAEIKQLQEKHNLLKEEQSFTGLKKEQANVAGVGADGPIIPEDIAELDELKAAAAEYYKELISLNDSAEDQIYHSQAEHQARLDELVMQGLLAPELAAQAEIELKKSTNAQLDELDQERADKRKKEAQDEINSIASISTSIGTALGSLTDDSDSNLSKTANAFRSFASSMVASSQAIAAATALGGVDAATMKTSQKLIHYATIMASFATITSNLAGSRMNGGGIQAGGMYAINESGKSEILNEGGKQYLLAGKNASITGQGAMNSMNGSNNSSMVVSQTINVTGTGDQELITKMGQAAEQGAKLAEANYIKQMNNKTGKIFMANRNTYGTGRTTGRAM